MHVNDLSLKPSVLNTFVAEIRDKTIQKDKMRFRRNIERIGEIIAYQMSKTFPYHTRLVTTTFGDSITETIADEIVICSVLRAGLPLHQGLLNYFDASDNAFISAYRHHVPNTSTFNIKVEYVACPNLNDKILILADPMLATGQSLVSAYKALARYGTPKNIHIASVLGSKPGIDYVSKNLPVATTLWVAAVDNALSAKGYIMPGLGDAGDLAFGEKLQH